MCGCLYMRGRGRGGRGSRRSSIRNIVLVPCQLVHQSGCSDVLCVLVQ